VRTSNEHYLNNPLIHRNRRLAQSASTWVRSFACEDMRPLIICRGPIRREAMDVFEEMGICSYGILLSEKDSIVYSNALAPELRTLTDPDRVHRVPDYTGASKEERTQRIRQIIAIAKDNGYDSIFAGYGFMSEDEELVKAIEQAGLTFIGPCSRTVRGAGFKDEAKRTALAVGVSVTPGIDNVTALTLLAKSPDTRALRALAEAKNLDVDPAAFAADVALETQADAVLDASYRRGVDLFSIEELCTELQKRVAEMYHRYPQNRIRLKAIGGGGGKGQRILSSPESFDGRTLEERIAKAAARAPERAREILGEVKALGVGDNKNILIELNIETTRHQEIQVIGNGTWATTLGGRDCSLQMHEQKLLEVSVTEEELSLAIAAARAGGRTEEARVLESDLVILRRMEDEAARFGAAVGLDSVSTFECIVERDHHFFMEMNTRIQVEHRVTELCYGLRFVNPDDHRDEFVVESLVEAMVLLARHKQRLPKPGRVHRHNASVEARLNATNQALQPHAGGVIRNWSNALEGEIRDDQGISLHNPDTGVFMSYTLAGAYDSNIALLLTVGNDRLDGYQRLAEILRITQISGKDLATNLEFHYGLVSWFIGAGINARPTTRFILPYLTAVGRLRECAVHIDLEHTLAQLRRAALATVKDAGARKALEGCFDRKQTLLLRPIQKLFAEPHLLSGWLSRYRDSFAIANDALEFRRNPIELLADTYHFLNMEWRESCPPAYMIWDHDNALLQDALAFYDALAERLGTREWSTTCTALASVQAVVGVDAPTWEAVRAAHAGYQAAFDLLLVLPYVARVGDFFSLRVNPDLSIHIPDELLVPGHQTEMAKVLVPPPVAKSDEILAVSGGMFYPREAPGAPEFVGEGQHFDQGDPLYIVEVMKMFNKVYAPFSGTIEKVLVNGEGVIIKKGQPVFKVIPDERIVEESPEERQQRRIAATARFLAALEAKA
jgi:acetyl/propionyl-CoA carboxylase alpha subunit